MQAKKLENKEALRAFAHRLSVLAGRKHLKQVGIARHLNTAGNPVSPQRVGSWFQARNFPGGDVEFALADLLGTNRDWLIEGKETTENKGGGGGEGIQAPYRNSGSLEHRSATREGETQPKMLQPGFAPKPTEPTEQECIDYFLTYLSHAAHNRGGLGHAWNKLQQNFKLEEFAPPKNMP